MKTLNRDVLKIISTLMLYPNPELFLVNWDSELKQQYDPFIRCELSSFLKYLKSDELIKLQENYVRTFDFSEPHNLYLTSSRNMEESKRGFILAELIQIYENAGFTLTTSEPPDFLPLFLEILSQCDEEVSFTLLNRFHDAIDEKTNSLTQTNSPYASLFTVLQNIINQNLDEEV